MAPEYTTHAVLFCVFFSRANGDLARFLKAHNGDNFVKTHGADINKLVHRITSLFIR